MDAQDWVEILLRAYTRFGDVFMEDCGSSEPAYYCADEQPWTLDAGSVHLAFEQLRESEEVTATNVREVVAWNDDHVPEGLTLRGLGLQTHHADSYLKTRLPRSGTYTASSADGAAGGGLRPSGTDAVTRF